MNPIIAHMLVLILFSTLVDFGRSYEFTTKVEVVDDGAVGDGYTDDTLAFMISWSKTCNAETEDATMVVSLGYTFLVQPITFSGPCYPKTITFLVLGTIIAPESPQSWIGKHQGRWIIFQGVNGLNINGLNGPSISGPSVNGLGILDGRGQYWWAITCKINPQLPDCVKLAPTVLSILGCNQVSMSHVMVVDSPQTHILLSGTKNVTIEYLTISSPGNSPNTDGIHISSSYGIFISATNISSGDDCVSIGDHTSDIKISEVNCGPGHGISIGSLGRSGNEVNVKNIVVVRTQFNRTTNGVRIKTWQVGRGYVRGIRYKDLSFTDVQNPIIIDQYYCDVRGACEQTETGVEVSDVRYSGAFGTSNTKIAINLNCSQAVPCKDIILDSIKLVSSIRGKSVISSCNNAFGSARRVIQPQSCLPEPI